MSSMINMLDSVKRHFEQVTGDATLYADVGCFVSLLGPPRRDNAMFRVVLDFWRPHWSTIVRRDDGWCTDIVTPAPRANEIRGVWEHIDTINHLVWSKHVCTPRESLVFPEKTSVFFLIFGQVH